MISTFVSQLDSGSRSVLHFDATYYMAQAVGFSPQDAFTIAAYNEATDLGQFVLYDQNGSQVVDPAQCTGSSQPTNCQFATQTTYGINRNNFMSGGVFFHFMAQPAGAARTDGLSPDVSDPVAEPFLAHVRRWVYGLGPLCLGGLTNRSAAGDYATGSSCFDNTSTARNPPSIVGHMPFLTKTGAITSVDWISQLGEQTIVSDPSTGEPQKASLMNTQLPASAVPLVKLGIYLHALGDRVSHHRCVDTSFADGPRPADAGPVLLNPVPLNIYIVTLGLGSDTPPDLQTTVIANPDFVWHYDLKECDQLNHAQRHTYETGTNQNLLSDADQTAKPGLSLVFSELLAYAQANKIPGAMAVTSDQADAVVASLMNAVETAGAMERIEALNVMAGQYGWLPLPGYAGVSPSQWQAQSGGSYFGAGYAPKSYDSSGATSSSNASSGGGALSLWVIVLMAAGVASRRLQRASRHSRRH